MPQNTFDDKSTLVGVMAWCRQATSHYLSQCWPRSLSPYGITRPQWVKAYTWYLFRTLEHDIFDHRNESASSQRDELTCRIPVEHCTWVAVICPVPFPWLCVRLIIRWSLPDQWLWTLGMTHGFVNTEIWGENGRLRLEECCINRGYPANRALSAMRKHGG